MPNTPSPPHRGSATSRAKPAVAVFTRIPFPGRVKTRLIPALGAEGAAELHRALLTDTLRKLAGLRMTVEGYCFGAGGSLPASLLPASLAHARQQGRDLGERLERACGYLLRRHARALIIGTDSPGLAPSTLRAALAELRLVDAVLGPCPDGGFYLIALRRAAPGLFRGVRLGTEHAFHDTLDRLLTMRWSCAVLDPLPDIDRPEDLLALKKSLLASPRERRLMPATWKFLSAKTTVAAARKPGRRHKKISRGH